MAGHLSLCFASPHALIAGSSSGLIRFWNTKQSQSIQWEVMADTSVLSFVSGVSSVSENHSVLHVQPLVTERPTLFTEQIPQTVIANHDPPTRIAAMTRGGVISIWDMSQMVAQALGSRRVPTCVFRLGLWEDFLDVRWYDAVVGVDIHPKEPEIFVVTLRKGNCHLIDLNRKTCTASPGNKGHCSAPRVVDVENGIIMRGGDVDGVSDTGSAPVCTLSSHWESYVSNPTKLRILCITADSIHLSIGRGFGA